MPNSARLGVRSRHALRLYVRPRAARRHKTGQRHHTFRRYSGVGGGAANFRSAAVRAKNHARMSAKAKAKAAVRTAKLRAFMKSPAHRQALALAARQRALQNAKKRVALLRSPARLAALRQAARKAAQTRRKGHKAKPLKHAKHSPVKHKPSKHRAPKRPAKRKPTPSGAPISATNYLNMF